MSKSSLRDKLDGNSLDLSLSELVEVPVKELLEFPKATHLDLSCNKLEILPTNFPNLIFLVKLDLSKNKLTELPTNFGCLRQLQHLDLYSNQLHVLPVSFCLLKSLKWLDLKNNPLEAQLMKTAGDCLDQKQCQQCASKVVALMQEIQSNLEREKQKRLKEERALDAARKAQEEEEQQRQRKLKKAEKEKRKAKAKKVTTEELTSKGQTFNQTFQNGKEKTAKKTSTHKTRSGSWCGFFVKTLLLLLLLVPILAFGAQVALNISKGPIPATIADCKVLLQGSMIDFQKHVTIGWEVLLSHSLEFKKQVLAYSKMAYSKWFPQNQDGRREL